MCCEIGKEKQCLLQPPSRRGEIQTTLKAVSIGHLNLAALWDVNWIIERDAKQVVDFLADGVPCLCRRAFIFYLFFARESVAKIAEDLGGAAFSNADIDGAGIEPGFIRRKPGHRWQKRDADILYPLGYWHAFEIFPFGQSERTAVKGLLIGIIKLEATRPRLSPSHALHENIYPNILSSLPAIDRLNIAHMQILPEQIRMGNGNGDQVPPVDRHARTLLRFRPALVLFPPTLEARIPKGESLKRGCFAGVVRANKNNGIAELYFDIPKTFEFSTDQFRQHVPSSPYWECGASFLRGGRSIHRAMAG